MYDLTSLQGVPIFGGLTVMDLGALGEIAQPVACERGDRLLERGIVLTHFYIVLDGRYALTAMLDTGVRQVETTLEIKAHGEALGWSALVKPRCSLYAVYCVWPGSVLAFHRDGLNKLMSVDTGLGFRLMQNLADLVGNRLATMHDLWRAEVEHSSARVKHWTRPDLLFGDSGEPHSHA